MSKSGLTSITLQPRESLDCIASVLVRRLHQALFGGSFFTGRRFRHGSKMKSADDGTDDPADNMFAPERFRSLSDFLCKVAPAFKNKHPGVDVELSRLCGLALDYAEEVLEFK